MTIPEKLVQAAIEATCVHTGKLEICFCEKRVRKTLAAAFGALPACIEENPPEPIVVGRHPQWFRGFDDCLAYLAREFGEPHPLNPYRDGEGRSLDERPTP